MSAIELVDELRRVLGGPSPSAQDVAAQLGEVVEEQPEAATLVVRPAAAAFRRAWVVGREGRTDPTHVTLELADTQAITQEQLEQAFGDARALPQLHPGSARQLAYYPDGESAVLASVDDEGAVTQITVRRDA